MAAQAWIVLIALGGLAGMIGQMARIVVGLKKAQEEAAAQGAALKDVFETSRLSVSLAIGFTAGALAAITVRPSDPIAPDVVVAFAAAGYSGADFIEGLMSKQLAKITGGTGVAPVTVPAAALPASADGSVG